ncbi:nucleotide sugar dehydrogenase [Parasegetibacter sp. NRK P23]|uniref:nucleotide sugar dehydrogenase n=1 Tax=Parasegetibacter sp. NRK P23 TaxID=2942999 RepID=UPI00204340FA|nr:nucleotide sugar dehydrogenase [Parasegetibacter sp. NRK P23]MCM5527622.1 nucleotide sugar dehydrogenase [Parasegetibacter sp. NRK P23]
MSVYAELIAKETRLAVIGLGYVGLPLALKFAKKVAVIGFDINQKRVDMMNDHIDPSNELEPTEFEGCDIVFTADLEKLKGATVFIVAVPTPVDEYKVPDLRPVLSASQTIGKVIKPGDYVVFESTVYPGCTEEDCLPVIENLSGLKMGRDFKLGYSPERINPGDKVRNLTNTIKIVSGCDAESLEEIAKIYELVVEAGLHKATSIKVAEAGKIVENIQRDLNISLMNELSIIFDKMGIATNDVIEAAGTKWNFAKYYPGLVGGHCIGVDPYYLTYKAQQLGYNSKVISAGRFVNDEMPRYVSKKIVQHIIKNSPDAASAKVLVLGATFKENVSDIRNSKVADLVKDLLDFSLHVDFVDPYAEAEDVAHEYGLTLNDTIGEDYDAVVLAVAHDPYKAFDEAYFKSITRPNALLADLKGIFRGQVNNMNYWSL